MVLFAPTPTREPLCFSDAEEGILEGVQSCILEVNGPEGQHF